MDDIFLNVRLESEAFDAAQVQVRELDGHEAISRLFEFDIRIVHMGHDGIDAEDLLRYPVTLIFERGGNEVRRLYGMVAEVEDCFESEGDYASYRLRVVPRAWRLTLMRSLDIFLALSVPDIIRKVLGRAGLTEGEDFALRLYQTYPVREFVMQYQETHLDFIARLAEHLGISYFFVHDSGKDMLVFSDANTGFPQLAPDGTALYNPGGLKTAVFDFKVTTQTISSRYVVRDYNYRNPQLALGDEVDIGAGQSGEITEYGPNIKTPDEGKHLAMVRAEELLCRRRQYLARSDLQTFTAGVMATIENLPREDLSILVTDVHHHATQPVLGTGDATERSYTNRFEAVTSQVPFRPERLTPRPRVDGMLNGVVDRNKEGDQQEYAEVDEQGRYRIRFLFDPTDPRSHSNSHAVRMAQPHAGPGYGMHFPLRPGTEVLITFINGDPDRPVIASTVPNPVTPSPVQQANLKRNVVRTGGGNEINMDDNDGKQRIKLSTPHLGSTLQLGSPNAPEAGVMVATAGASTSMAGTASGSFSTFTGKWGALRSLHGSPEIISFAEKLSGIEKGFMSAELLLEGVGTGVEIAKGYRETKMAGYEKETALAGETLKEKAKEEADKWKELETAADRLETCTSTPCALQPRAADGTIDTSAKEAALAAYQRYKDAATSFRSQVDAQEYEDDDTDLEAAKSAKDAVRTALDCDDGESAASDGGGGASTCCSDDLCSTIEAHYDALVELGNKRKDQAQKAATQENYELHGGQGLDPMGLTIAGTASGYTEAAVGTLSAVYALYGLYKAVEHHERQDAQWAKAATTTTSIGTLNATGSGVLLGENPMAISGGFWPIIKKARKKVSITGAEDHAVLCGFEKAFVWGETALLYGGAEPDSTSTGGQALVVGKELAALLSAEKAVVKGKESVRLGAGVDETSTAYLQMNAVDKSITAKAGLNMTLAAKHQMSLSSDENLLLKSKVKTELTNDMQENKLTMGAGGVTVTSGPGGAVKLVCGEASLKVSANGVTLSFAGSTVEVTAAGVSIKGPMVNLN